MKNFLVTIILFLFHTCYSQPSITWNKIYDGPRHFNDGGRSICKSNIGNYFVFGYTYTGIPGRVFILKINEYGDTLWTKVFTGLRDIITSIPTYDGGCIFAGRGENASVVKMDQNGNIIWLKNYLSQQVNIYDISETPDGYICCGVRFGFFDGYLLKIKHDGTFVWEKIFPTSLGKQFYSVELTDEGKYIISGISSENQTNPANILVSQVDTSGKLEWEKKYYLNNRGGSGNFITNTKNGYFLIGATTEEVNGITDGRIFIMNLNNNGDSTYTKVFPFYKSDQITCAEKISDNKFVISSLLTPDTVTGKVIIIDSIGNILHQTKYTGIGYQFYNAILPLSNGDIILTGQIKNNVFNLYEDLIVTRMDSNLNSPIISINQLSESIPKDFNLYQNYPNPFNPITKIKFELAKRGNAQIRVYDGTGKLVIVLLDTDLTPGTYEVDFNATNLSSGIYYCKLTGDGNITQVCKMVLLK